MGSGPKGSKSCRTQGEFCSPEICPLWLEICPLRPAICLSNLKSVYSNLVSLPSIQPSDLKSAPRPQICPLRPQTRWMNRQTKVPRCSTGLRLLWGHCAASSLSNSQSCKAGQWVRLTTYCPWVTGFLSAIGSTSKNSDKSCQTNSANLHE